MDAFILQLLILFMINRKNVPLQNNWISGISWCSRKRIRWSNYSLSKKNWAVKKRKAGKDCSDPLYFLWLWPAMPRGWSAEKFRLCCTEPDLSRTWYPYLSGQSTAPFERTVRCQRHHEDAGLFPAPFSCIEKIFLWWQRTFFWKNRLLPGWYLPLSFFSE